MGENYGHKLELRQKDARKVIMMFFFLFPHKHFYLCAKILSPSS